MNDNGKESRKALSESDVSAWLNEHGIEGEIKEVARTFNQPYSYTADEEQIKINEERIDEEWAKTVAEYQMW